MAIIHFFFALFLTQQIWSHESTFDPLVSKDGTLNSEYYKVVKFLPELIDVPFTLLQMRDVTFAPPGHWHHKFVPGKTGYNNSQEDFGALLSYNRELNVLIISYRGTSSSYDWQVNFDAASTPIQLGHDCTLEMHQGYGKRMQSYSQNLDRALEEFRERGIISAENFKNLRLFFTGHSAGSSLALATMLEKKVQWEDNYKDVWHNRPNRFLAYFFSPPRLIRGEESQKKAEALLGPNVIRQSVVSFDLAGSAPGGTWPARFFPKSLQPWTDYRGIGYLAADDFKRVYRVNSKQSGYVLRKFPWMWLKEMFALTHYTRIDTRGARTGPFYDPKLAKVASKKEIDLMLKRGQNHLLTKNPLRRFLDSLKRFFW